MKLHPSLVVCISAAALLAISGCTGWQAANTRNIAKDPSREAPGSGFVNEVDEPSARGVLTRVTPVDMFVQYRIALSVGSGELLFAARPTDTKDPTQVYRLPLESSSPVRVTSGGDDGSALPSPTPDGDFIVFGAAGHMWKVRSDGAGARIRIPGSGLGRDFAPHVSTDGRVVFFTYDPTTLTSLIWACRLDGGELTQYRQGAYPQWSPDGQHIVFEHDGDIWTMKADGTELTQVTSTTKIAEQKPTYSPDGSAIAFVSNEGKNGKPGKDFNIWTIAVTGTNKSQVTELKSWDSWPLWAPDGIYFVSGRAKGDEDTQRVWKMTLPSD